MNSSWKPRPGRRATRVVRVGDVLIGGSNPIVIQSMTNTKTRDVSATVGQIVRLVEAGCELVRVTTPGEEDVLALSEIRAELKRRGVGVPLAADVHFLPSLALSACDYVEKVRINPGNYAGGKRCGTIEYTEALYQEELSRLRDAFLPLIRKALSRGVALRIGVNHGSLSDRILSRFGDTPQGMVESALEFVRIAGDEGFGDIVLSMKASNTHVMVRAYRLLAACMDAEGMDYPLHLGVTEAGAGEDGRIKSALGIGALLREGLGDTIRVSLAEDPIREIPIARAIADMSAECVFKRREIEAYESESVRCGSLVVGGGSVVSVRTNVRSEGLRDLLSEAASIDPPIECLSVNAARVPAQSTKLLETSSSVPIVLRLESDVSPLPLSDLCFDALSVPLTPVPAEGETADNIGLKLDGRPLWLRVREVGETEKLIEVLRRLSGSVRIGVEVEGTQIAGLAREVAYALRVSGLRPPIHLHVLAGRSESALGVLIRASVELGSPLLDGIGSSVEISSQEPVLFNHSLAFGVLQASRVRMTRAEFIACPSCGRTLFDLESATARIRARTGHLSGVKIAVMGCIVNGPGEMADADFGYVGAGPGRVNLFVGKQCVARNVPVSEADDRLVALIRDRGLWREPPASRELS